MDVNGLAAWQSRLQSVLISIDRVGDDRSATASALLSAREAGLAELDQAERAVRRIRFSLNALVPVCRLPHEVLTHIFAYVRVIYPPGPRGLTRLGHVFVLHVCRLWRQVAIQSGALWADLEFNLGSTWLAQFLEWSRSYPITIATNPRTINGHPFLERIAQVLQAAPQRLRIIDLHGAEEESYNREDITMLLQLLSYKPTVQLECIHLSSQTPLIGPLPLQNFNTVSHMTITETVVGQDTPWSTLPHTLLSLELLKSSTRTNASSTLESANLQGLVARLGHCTGLTNLVISRPFMDSLPLPGDLITLPALCSLSLMGRGTSVLAFLQTTTFLRTLKKLRLELNNSTSEELTSVVARITQAQKCFTDCSYRSLSLHQLPSWLSLSGVETDEGTLPAIPGSNSFRGTLSILAHLPTTTTLNTIPPRVEVNMAILTNMLSLIDMSALRTLFVTLNTPLPPSLFHLYFKSACHVRRLKLQYLPTLSCISALGRAISPQLPLTRENTLFPILETLAVEDYNFKTVGGDAVSVVAETLAARSALECAPREFRLKNCYAGMHDLLRLVDAVPENLRQWTLESLKSGVRLR